ncbi:MAG: selenocysteine-specific translation elongation factor [Geobacteraceae bacterium]|nr:selenocysteine-specific translation elongation factor [Geobacteraceae bacterium]
MKHLILGTAGHIDHGKTSLVRALTGVDCDRLPEEKRRGITIELGFAHLEIEDKVRFGIVDVPGHERFIRTMVAGVGGIDVVMLVIAADEGVMPQTREHFDICRLLGVKRGLVALTKCDLVMPEWLELVQEEVAGFLSDSFLDGAPIVPVSSKNGVGLDKLEAELERIAAGVEPKKADGAFRLPVDRVFTVTGFGTVVTGTLLGGSIAIGDEVEILPGVIASRVRGIQAHGGKRDRGVAGERLAVNLQGVEHTALERGDSVVPRDHYTLTSAVDVHLNHLGSSQKILKHRASVRLHSAAFEVPAKVILLGNDSLLPGESCFAQLRLGRPVLLLPGDPFVIRSYSPNATIGGGRVLDPGSPKHRRRSDEALALLEAALAGDEPVMVLKMISTALFSGVSLPELVARSGFSQKRLESILFPLLSSGAVLQVCREPKVYLSRESFDELKAHLLKEAVQFCRANPLKEGISREELKSRMPKRSDQRFFMTLVTSLEKDGRIIPDRDIVRVAATDANENGDDTLLTRAVEELILRGALEPPTVKELCEKLALGEKNALAHLSLLARSGRAVKMKGDIFYSPLAVTEVREKLIAYLKKHGEITPGSFREVTGLSRKFMIPLLEYFDQEKLTIRVGDIRMLRRR